ncbi:hypothetical protein [Nakamurella leprariae]|uniref:DUF4360 domain-containing protein n=1 Tax=Nakamurella leprariae TaxID=2803911 RepID=A0A938YEI6_9ACTN|nr:hypothetical protein [Nakamurella leprariae]MBM9468379.1 hypothetical protein [Nakamurella leprariae]
MRCRNTLLVSLLSTLLLLTVPMTAQASTKQNRPLTLTSHITTVTLSPPQIAPICDQGSFLNCGTVTVQATFSGLAGRALPPRQGPMPEGNLTGTATLARAYGCERDGKRLRAYNRTVVEPLPLNTRRGFGFTVPRTGDQLSVSTYGFPANAEPRNCPAGATPTVYAMKVSNVRLQLSFTTGFPIAASSHSLKGSSRWDGAVPTPSAISS